METTTNELNKVRKYAEGSTKDEISLPPQESGNVTEWIVHDTTPFFQIENPDFISLPVVKNAIDFINALSKEQFQTLSCKATENIIIKKFHHPIIAKHLMNSSGDFENYRFLNGEDAQGKGAQWDQYNPFPEELFQLVTSC